MIWTVPPPGTGTCYVAYPQVDDVDGFYARAAEAGAEVLKAPTDEPWGMCERGLRSPDVASLQARRTAAPEAPMNQAKTCRRAVHIGL